MHRIKQEVNQFAMLDCGLALIGEDPWQRKLDNYNSRVDKFKSHYGSHPLVLPTEFPSSSSPLSTVSCSFMAMRRNMMSVTPLMFPAHGRLVALDMVLVHCARFVIPNILGVTLPEEHRFNVLSGHSVG